MDHFAVFPDNNITAAGPVADQFLKMGLHQFSDACRFVHELPYGYNSDRDDLMILFKENRGSCTTKHAVIATLAEELGLPIYKAVGIYAMTEEIVTGAETILARYDLPYVPMIHCFLVCEAYRVDLTEDNDNGKNRSIDRFLFTAKVIPNISAKDEYLLYRQALQDKILGRPEMQAVEITRILHAREEGIERLKSLVTHW